MDDRDLSTQVIHDNGVVNAERFELMSFPTFSTPQVNYKMQMNIRRMISEKKHKRSKRGKVSGMNSIEQAKA